MSFFAYVNDPVKSVSGMDLCRFGNRIDPLWRIKKEDTYSDIGQICEEARLELQHLLGDLPDRLLRLLEGARECRNPIMHPRIYVESLEDANSLYFIVLKAVGIMVRKMAAPDP